MIFLYYRASKYRRAVNEIMLQWIRDGEISPEMGRGFRAAETNKSTSGGRDLIRGFNNYTNFKNIAENSPDMLRSPYKGRYSVKGAEIRNVSEGEGTPNPESPISDGRGGFVPNGGTPLPPEGERSRLNAIKHDGVFSREIRLMHDLYGDINTLLYPIVAQVVNESEYSGSNLYDYDLPEREADGGGNIRDDDLSRESLARMTDMVLDKAAEKYDGFDEIICDDNRLTAGYSRKSLLKADIESLLLTEIFLSRRPFYRDTAEIYRFFDGRYDGMNPTY